jgi:hypothetical protein
MTTRVATSSATVSQGRPSGSRFRSTKLYDRSNDTLTLDEIERITL